MTEFDIQENKRVLAHALAQQRLEGLSLSSKTEADLARVAKGEIPLSYVINDLYARYAHVEVLQR